MSPVRDVFFAFREMKRSPGFAAVLIVVLALGIGANAAMFALLNDVLLKPLACPEGHRIMHLGTAQLKKGVSGDEVSYPDFLDWRDRSRSFDDIGLITSATVRISDRISSASRRRPHGSPPTGSGSFASRRRSDATFSPAETSRARHRWPFWDIAFG
jgi:hypothetical protein